MKNFLLIGLVICCLTSYSLDKEQKISLSISCQPSISRKLERFDKEHEKSKLGTQFEVSIDYKLNSKSALSSGLGYKNSGYALKFLEFKLYPDGIPDPEFPDDLKLIQNYNYNFLSIPLVYKRSIKSIDRIKFNAVGGVSLDYFINGRVKSETISNGHLSKGSSSISLPKKFNISALVGSDLLYSLNNKLSIFLEPNCEINFINYYKSDKISFRFWDLGLKVGINYAL